MADALDFTTDVQVMSFSKEEDCRHIYQTFGEGETLKQRFPFFYQALEKGKRGLQASDNNDGYYDSTLVYSIKYDEENKKLTVDYNITLKQTASCLFVYIYNDDNSIFASLFYEEKQIVEDSQTFDNVTLDKDSDFNLYFECPFIPGDDDALHGMKVSMDVYYNSTDVVDKITVDAPKLVNSKTSPIKVTYGRTLGSGETADYLYPEDRTSSGNQKVYLPVAGSAALKSGYTVKEVQKLDACLMVGGDYGTILYRNADGMAFTIAGDAKSFSWKGKDDWNDEISKSVQYGNRDYIFDLSVIFTCNETSGEKHRVHVTSHDSSVSSPAEKVIPEIRLYWGCLAADSLVHMADGGTKEIRDIKIGDYVMTPGGQAEVADIVRGTEEELLCLETEQGCRVKGSILHPILTDQGFLPLRDMKGTTRVMTEDGPQTVRYCYRADYHGEVFGLELKGADAFYADKIAVGTNRIQGEMAGISPYRHHEKYDDIRREFHDMIAFALQGRRQ